MRLLHAIKPSSPELIRNEVTSSGTTALQRPFPSLFPPSPLYPSFPYQAQDVGWRPQQQRKMEPASLKKVLPTKVGAQNFLPTRKISVISALCLQGGGTVSVPTLHM